MCRKTRSSGRSAGRACRGIARAAVWRQAPRRGRFDLIVTHHPLVTCWTELFCRGRRTCPHVAFAFNFTALAHRLATIPSCGGLFRRSTGSSSFPSSSGRSTRIISSFPSNGLKWSTGASASRKDSTSGASPPAESNSHAICAVGSQARDYATLLEAMRRIPHIPLVLVATPANLRGLAVPPNVTVKFDIPRREAEAVVRQSRFMVLPLLHARVPCGHVTMVTAMYCSRAIVATESSGISDYLVPGHNGLTVPPGDPAALAAAIEKLWNDPATAARLGTNGRDWALAHCTEERTIGYVRDLIHRVRAGEAV